MCPKGCWGKIMSQHDWLTQPVDAQRLAQIRDVGHYHELMAKALVDTMNRSFESIIANGFPGLAYYKRRKVIMAKTPKGKKVFMKRYKGRG